MANGRRTRNLTDEAIVRDIGLQNSPCVECGDPEVRHHEHEWGVWLVAPYFPEFIVRRCACGAEDKQEVE